MRRIAPRHLSLAEKLRFYSRDDASGCRLWTGGTNWAGYGLIWWESSYRRAHILSWELKNSASATGMFVCHHCDVRPCINPDHLFLGTTQDNTADMVRKNRHVKGERQGAAKLTADQVLAIRRDSRFQRVIAAHFGVSQTVIWAIKARKWWKHLP